MIWEFKNIANSWYNKTSILKTCFFTKANLIVFLKNHYENQVSEAPLTKEKEQKHETIFHL